MFGLKKEGNAGRSESVVPDNLIACLHDNVKRLKKESLRCVYMRTECVDPQTFENKVQSNKL